MEDKTNPWNSAVLHPKNLAPLHRIWHALQSRQNWPNFGRIWRFRPQNFVFTCSSWHLSDY